MRAITTLTAATLLCVVAAPAGAAADPLRDRQWALDVIRADSANAASDGGGITIAVVDTGVDLDHPDLKPKIASSYDCRGSCGGGGDDDNGHGSHVAGIAAAATANGIGVAGTASRSRLMSVKVLDADGSGTCDDVARGIRWAADHAAKVINLSLGPGITINVVGLASCLDRLQDAVGDAWSKGAVIVAAAGNESLPASFYANTANLYVVGATGPDDRVASYSNDLIGVDVFAPGGDSTGGCDEADCIVSAWRGGGYAVAEGTSMATPHVAGLAALLMAKGLDNAATVERIEATTDTTRDGAPRINAARAVGPAAGSGGGGGSSPGGGSAGAPPDRPDGRRGGSDGGAVAGSPAATPRTQPGGGGDDLGVGPGADSPPEGGGGAAGAVAAAAGALVLLPLGIRWLLRRGGLLR